MECCAPPEIVCAKEELMHAVRRTAHIENDKLVLVGKQRVKCCICVKINVRKFKKNKQRTKRNYLTIQLRSKRHSHDNLMQIMRKDANTANI